MTDITRLINDLNHRMHSAKSLGFDFLFLKLDDLDVIAGALETLQRANTTQGDHIEQLRDLVMMVKMLCRTVRKYNPESQQAANFTAYLQKEGLISAVDCLRDSDPLDTESEDRRG